MVLQHERLLRRMRSVVRDLSVHHRPHRRLVVVDQNAVPKHREIGRLNILLAIEFRRLKDDVVGLPFARFARDVLQRRPLSVNGARLAVGVRRIVIGIEHLNLIAAHQQHAAVAASLAVALHVGRRRPLDVQLAISEFLLGGNVAGVRDDFHIAVLNLPLRRSGAAGARNGAMVGGPFRKVLAVEQDFGVGRGVAAMSARSDDVGVWTREIVDVVGESWEHRGVLEPEVVVRTLLGCRRLRKHGAERDSDNGRHGDQEKCVAFSHTMLVKSLTQLRPSAPFTGIDELS